MALNYFSGTTSMSRSGVVGVAGDRAPDTTSRRFLQAVNALESGQWSEGFGLLSALANAGLPSRQNAARRGVATNAAARRDTVWNVAMVSAG